MKTLIHFIIGAYFMIPFVSVSQNNRCAAEEWTKEFEASPDFFRLKNQLEMRSEWRKSEAPVQRTMAVPDTIAVVVHVLYSSPVQNIPDSVIYRQIAILNEDFPRLNSDSVNTPAPFAALAGRSNFRFQLARRDNFGAITNGIVRWPTTHGPFSSVFDLIQTSAGGHDSWGGDYLNIYCVDIDPSTGAAGIALLSSNVCMIDYTYFGLSSPLSKGRVCTHEVGHCFSLKHIWGGEPQLGPFDCLNDDGVLDTPPQYEPGSICGSFPKTDSCTTSGNGIMYMNYMDYTMGVCQNMFSEGQMIKMNSTIASSLPGIINSTGLIPVPDFDAGCVSIIKPSGSECNIIFPKVVIRNWGAQPLTSLIVFFRVDNNTTDSINWTGNLSNFETDTLNLPMINVTGGAHIFTTYTGLPNGNTDAESLNDTANSAFNSGSAILVPFSEGFEGSFPPFGWSFTSPDSGFGFHLNTTVSSSGNNSIDFYGRLNSTYSGENVASLQTSFSNFTTPFLSFDFAHTYANCCGSLDTLDILVSDDCGQTFTLVSNLSGSSISTAPVVTINSSLFIPAANEWSTKVIDLSAFANSQDITLKFRLINMWGLQFYLDNVNIYDYVLNIPVQGQEVFSVYPNPNHGQFKISSINRNYNVEVFHPDGKLIYMKNFETELAEINLNSAKGIYFVRISNSDFVKNFKMVIE